MFVPVIKSKCLILSTKRFLLHSKQNKQKVTDKDDHLLPPNLYLLFPHFRENLLRNILRNPNFGS